MVDLSTGEQGGGAARSEAVGGDSLLPFYFSSFLLSEFRDRFDVNHSPFPFHANTTSVGLPKGEVIAD